MTRSRSKKKETKKSDSNALKTLHEDMKALIEINNQETTRFMPDAPDVPRIRFAADALYNVETSYVTTQNTNTMTPTYGTLGFSLGSSATFANYTTCFDMYRIIQTHVKIHITGSTSNQQYYTYIDHDDAGVPTAVTPFLNSKTMKIGFLNQIDERVIAPRFDIAAFAGAIFNGYANAGQKAFIDCASPGVQYYGLKYFVPATPGGVVTLNFIVTLMVQFKEQRSN